MQPAGLWSMKYCTLRSLARLGVAQNLGRLFGRLSEAEELTLTLDLPDLVAYPTSLPRRPTIDRLVKGRVWEEVSAGQEGGVESTPVLELSAVPRLQSLQAAVDAVLNRLVVGRIEVQEGD